MEVERGIFGKKKGTRSRGTRKGNGMSMIKYINMYENVMIKPIIIHK
jgi:hypothetical protein